MVSQEDASASNSVSESTRRQQFVAIGWVKQRITSLVLTGTLPYGCYTMSGADAIRPDVCVTKRLGNRARNEARLRKGSEKHEPDKYLI